MKRFSYIVLLLCILLCKQLQCSATHIFGADLLYKHISGNTYRVMVTLYADCGAPAEVFQQLYTATPFVIIYNNNTAINTYYLKPVAGSTGIEVSPVCPKEINNTVCNNGTLPGVRQFVYDDTITLPSASSKWRFVFNGELGGGYRAGRSQNITNIANGTVMQLEATLDNSSSQNSSPLYSTIPTPFYCINIKQQYNQGAIDPDGDSLAFNLVAGLDANSSGAVSYFPPFTPTYPLATSGGSFIFSPINGQMAFTPNILQDALVVNRVSEYRKGVLIGTSEREMTFIVRDNCDGTPPSPRITALSGATLTGSNIINICKGEPLISFDIQIDNPDGDTTYVTTSAAPGNATLTISNNSTPAPVAHFSWHTDTLPLGNYSFYMSIKNNHCPLYNTQTVAYTIKVVDYPTITALQLSPTECIHPAAIRFDLAHGFLPRKVTVMSGSSVVKTLIDSTGSDLSGIITDSLPAGNYVATVSCDAICTGSVSFTIADSGSFFINNISKSLCLGDLEVKISVDPVAPGANISWFTKNGTPLTDAPVINTSSTGNYSWYFIEYYKSCSSGNVYVNATVHALPVGVILNSPKSICYGDKVYLEATGGTTYTWLPEDMVKTDTGGPFAVILIPATLYVKVTDEYGCSDTTNITYSDIQQCCNFAYPNAFTPNNDGYNDGFRIVTYGNMLHYNLTIFNRWGQKIFWTSDPKKAWDGTFGGEPCEMGSYFYFLDAQCLTGPKEFHKGDITLVR